MIESKKQKTHWCHVSLVARWNFEGIFGGNPCAAKDRIFFGGVADLSPHAHEIALGKCIQLKN
jgi:hypothetical protein